MKKRQIGNSKLVASTIGLGCMSLNPENKKSEMIIHEAIELGVNYFDTADLYDFGQNEELLGKALKGKRKDVIIATKVGNQWNDLKTNWNWNPTKTYIKEAVKNSLTRLQTDFIDLYQLHGGTIDDPIDETIEAFEDLVKEGWIRYYGISSIRPNVIKEFINRSNLVSVMMQYNLLDRRPEEEMTHLFERNNISLIARGPVAKGLLSDNYRKKLKQDGYLNYSKQEVTNVIEQLNRWANDHNYELHELALLYCLHASSTATIIPGARTIDQLKKNITAATKPPLTKEMSTEIEQFLKETRYSTHR